MPPPMMPPPMSDLDATCLDWRVFTEKVKARAKAEGANQERARLSQLGVKLDNEDED